MYTRGDDAGDNDDANVTTPLIKSAVPFSMSQVPNAVYYDAYLRYFIAWLFVLGKISQAAGQNVLGLTALLALAPLIDSGWANFITVVLTIINVGVNSATRIEPIRNGFRLNQIFLVEKLTQINSLAIPKDSYVLPLAEGGCERIVMYGDTEDRANPIARGTICLQVREEQLTAFWSKNGKNVSKVLDKSQFSSAFWVALSAPGKESIDPVLCQEITTISEYLPDRQLYVMKGNGQCDAVSLTLTGEQELWDFHAALNTYFKEKDLPVGQNTQLITYDLSSTQLALFSKVLANQETKGGYDSSFATTVYLGSYAVCCVSMIFAALNAYLSGVTLVNKFFPEANEDYQNSIGLYILTCSTISYWFFNLVKMADNVGAFGQSLDNGLSSSFELIEITAEKPIPTDATSGQLYLVMREDSIEYTTHGMNRFKTITRDELNLGNSINAWDFGALNTPEVKERLAKIVKEHGNSCYKGYGINQFVMLLTVLASLFGTVAGCGMAYLMMIKGEERIPVLKDIDYEYKEFLALTNVVVSIFPSIFNFAAAAYGLLDKKYPKEKWVIPSLDAVTIDAANSVQTMAVVDDSTLAELIGAFCQRTFQAFRDSLTLGDLLAMFILTDAISNSLGGLVGMLMLVKTYIDTKGNAIADGFLTAFVAISFIDNVIMSFSFQKNGSDNTSKALNKLVILDELSKAVSLVTNLCSVGNYTKVKTSDPDLVELETQTPRIAISFTHLGDRPELATTNARRVSQVNELQVAGIVNHYELSQSPGGTMRQLLKSQGDYTTATPSRRAVVLDVETKKFTYKVNTDSTWD